MTKETRGQSLKEFDGKLFVSSINLTLAQIKTFLSTEAKQIKLILELKEDLHGLE